MTSLWHCAALCMAAAYHTGYARDGASSTRPPLAAIEVDAEYSDDKVFVMSSSSLVASRASICAAVDVALSKQVEVIDVV